LEIWECEQTGYRFYFPFNLSGDSNFYEFFQKFDWYYMPWKWEHDLSVQLIDKFKPNEVLEIGCARGAFLSGLKSRFSDLRLSGLELNTEAASFAISKGLNVKNELIENFSEFYGEKFDLVCNYQVLEHISNPKSFIENSLKCLKKGGKLIICVPNNNSFLKYEEEEPLNYPPHHMGLWNDYSLKNLTKIFNIKLTSIHFEPVQEYHIDWYVRLILKKYIANDFLHRSIFKLFKVLRLIVLFKSQIKKQRGHSVLVVFEKL
jgi:SAM-dependent methyltransferase